MFLPPRSPFGLIQEDLWPDKWKILVSCVMLNCTSRKQVEKILPEFFMRWPDAASIVAATEADLQSVIYPLGFKNRRSSLLKKLASSYLEEWQDVRSLPGVGEYGSRAWEIFCKNDMGDVAPKDHALTKYWHWRIKHDKKKNDGATREDREKSAAAEEGESRSVKAA
jgi:methyl-CpG-binding domain protein 4